MSRGMSMVASALALALVAAGCDGSGEPADPEGDPPAGADKLAVVAPPPTLGEGPLLIEARGSRSGAVRSSGGAPPGLLLTADRIVETTEDDTIRVLDRATLDVVWEKDFTTVDREYGFEQGVCAPPIVGPDRTTLVVAMTIEVNCGRVVVLDLETGRTRSDEALVREFYPDYDAYFYHDVRSLHLLKGTVWWVGDQAAGYVDEGGVPHEAISERDLRAHRGDDQVYAAAVVPEHDLLIAETGHGSPLTPGFRREWIGIHVADDADAEVVWRTDESPVGLGLPDLALPPEAELYADRPGAPFVAAVDGGRLAVGRLDPETGRLSDAVRIRRTHLSLFAPDYDRSYVVDGPRLFAAAGPRDELTDVVAFDLEAGRQLWRTPVADPPAVEPGQLPIVRSVTLGTDGDVYALVTDQNLSAAEIQRFDGESGAATGRWDVPASIDRFYDYDLHVVDDRAVLRMGTLVLDTGPRAYYLRVSD